MLVELSIVPLGVGDHLSGPLADVLKIIDASGVSYKLTPAGTCREGGWDEVMELVKQCHDKVREQSGHVFTSIRIEDEEGASDKLDQNVFGVEQKAARELAK